MSAAIALMFLAEAASACVPSPAANRFKAGATVVRAIVAVDPKSFDPAAAKPAAATEPGGTEQAVDDGDAPASGASDQAGDTQPAEQCEAAPIPTA